MAAVNKSFKTMSDDWRNLDLRDAIAPNLKVLKYCGYWPDEDASKSERSMYNIFTCIVFIFGLMIFVVSEFFNILFSLDDLEKVTEGSFLFISHWAEIVKLYIFITKRSRVLTLINNLQQRTFKARNLKQYKMLKRAIFEGQFMFYMFISASIATCILWSIFPFVDKTSDHIKLPLSGYYPFETNYTPIFQIMFFYQISTAILNAAANVSIDTFVSTLISLMCGELDVMNDSLTYIKELSEEALLRRGRKIKFTKEDESDFPKELQQEMDTVLAECVQQHLDILESTKEIGALFSFGVLAQFSVGCVVICITMFELTVVELFSLQFISMVLYQACMLLEIMLYCWFGNELILKSSNICYSLFSADWNRCNMPFKKSMVIVMTRAQVPIRVYAGNLFTLSLVSFAAILRTSWSYFAVLRGVHDEE